MKVAMGIRADGRTIHGGDVVQMEKTAVELERAGCRVECRFGDLGDMRDVDIVHVFNTTRISDSHRMVCQAQAARRPVVVSTIWHSMGEMAKAYGEIYGLKPFPIWSYTAAKEVYYAHRNGENWDLRLALGYRSRLRHVIGTADAILPNSKAELRAIVEETGCQPRSAFVVPNGYEHREVATPVPWNEREKVVCAGRIEPRKNQARLARVFRRAVLGPSARLYFFGASLAQARRYRKKLEHELVVGRSEYGGKLPQLELYAQYSQTRVTVLPSYFETTGLSALEGLAYGSSVVVSDSPCTREYFGEAVHYCDPYSDESIQRALERAWQTPPPPSADLLSRFTWQEAARVTLQAYRRVLDTKANNGER